MQVTKANSEQPIGGQFEQRIERKFFVKPRDIGFAHALLRQVCRPDSEYPVGQINSLYFDTADLDQHERSASGEYRKDKVRIRWYGENNAMPQMAPVFLELKSRRGFASSKRRDKFPVSRDKLEPDQLGAGIIDRTVLTNTIAGFGHFPSSPLRPIITISYLRYRFTEMLSGFRVSLDHNIRSTFVAREFGYGEKELPLIGGVIEVKGSSMELPGTLRKIKLLNTDWSRFSKYSHCIDTHLTDLGTVGRLWPSGRMPGV